MKEARAALVQNFSLAWTLICALLFLPAMSRLGLPRFSLEIVTALTIFLALGAAYSAELFERQNRLKLWASLIFFALVLRLILAWPLTASEPWAEAGLAAGAVAGLVLVAPLFRQTRLGVNPAKARELLRNREFTRYLFATLGIVVGTFLFINADRIVAQPWFGEASDNNMGLVRWGLFDGYQTAGLLGRSLLWGTQPILVLLLVRRANQQRTSADVRRLAWFYLGALGVGAILLHQLAVPLSRLFGGADQDITAYFIPGFSFAMVPLGLLQGLGVFALASAAIPNASPWRRQYRLYASARVGRHAATDPELHVRRRSRRAGSAAFLGVVRWGRIQP